MRPPDAGVSPDPHSTFELLEEESDSAHAELEKGEVLARNQLLSAGPYHRFGLYDPTETSSQFPPTPVGAAVAGWLSWEHFSRVSATDTQFLKLVDDDIDPAWHLGPLGTPGFTGYAGLTQVCKPQPGETAIVSAVGGAVGSVAAQAAKQMGLRIVGTAGSPAKAAPFQQLFDLDAVIDHRHSDALEDALKQACPDGIDVYLDLVGGQLLDAVIANMNTGGRIAIAGMVSQYNLASNKRYGLRNLDRIVGMDITIQSYDNGGLHAPASRAAINFHASAAGRIYAIRAPHQHWCRDAPAGASGHVLRKCPRYPTRRRSLNLASQLFAGCRLSVH